MMDPSSADFAYVSYLIKSTLTSHRLSYGSDEWCEPPQLRVVSITMLPWAQKQVRLYRKERDRILKRGDLPEIPFPMPEGLRPMVSKDANEVFLFHGCPWEAVPKICKEGFDWKYRGTH